MTRASLQSWTVGAAVLSVTAVLAQSIAPGGYNLSWNTVDGGGGTSGGGGFELSGTIGQTDAGVVLSGGGFEVAGGFWPGGIPPVPDCLGDANNNGVVNIDDLVIVITSWGQTGGPGDVNHNGIVNIDDLVQVIVHWGMCP